MPNGITYRGGTLSDRDAREIAAHVESVTEDLGGDFELEALPAEGEPAAPVVRVVDVDTRLAEAAEQIAALSRG